jgi:hypothetical protein
MHYTMHLNTNGDMEKFFKRSKVTIEEGEFPPPLDDDAVDAEVAETDTYVKQVIQRTDDIKSAEFGKAVLSNIAKQREDELKEEASIDAIASRDEEAKPVVTAEEQKEAVEKIQLVVDTFGAQEVIIEEHEKPDMPGAAVAEKVKENREAKQAEGKMPEEFFAWYTKARRILAEAKLIPELDEVWIEHDVTSTGELAKDKKKQVKVRDDINKILRRIA